MKLETTISPCKEVFVEGNGISVTINTWSNCEGATLVVTGRGDNIPMRMAGSFRWEELAVIATAIAAAQAA